MAAVSGATSTALTADTDINTETLIVIHSYAYPLLATALTQANSVEFDWTDASGDIQTDPMPTTITCSAPTDTDSLGTLGSVDYDTDDGKVITVAASNENTDSTAGLTKTVTLDVQGEHIHTNYFRISLARDKNKWGK